MAHDGATLAVVAIRERMPVDINKVARGGMRLVKFLNRVSCVRDTPEVVGYSWSLQGCSSVW